MTGGARYAAYCGRDNIWTSNESKKELQRMMEELAVKIGRKVMEPKQESLCQTRTYAKDAEWPMAVEGDGYCGGQDVEGHRVGDGWSKCSGFCGTR